MPKSYGDLIIKAIRNELAGFYTFTAQGSLKSFGYLFEGTVEVLQPDMDLGRIYDTFENFIKAVKDTVIPSLDIESANGLVESLGVIIAALIKKQKEGVNIQMINSFTRDILDFLIAAQCSYATYQLQKKEEPENIIVQKKKVE